jgi:hypothetical protein
MRTTHRLHSITLFVALGGGACADDDDDDAAGDSSGSANDDADPSAGDDADPSAGDDADPSAGDDADPSAGDDGSDGPAESSGGAEGPGDESSGAADTGQGGEFSAGGTVSSDAAPFMDNDGIGDLYIVAFDDECGGNAASGTTVVGADLSDPASSVPFTIEGLPAGTFLLTAFLDDNGDADPNAPGPNMGDIVMADGVMPGCVEVEIVDASVDGAALVLNLALPFDPP